MVNMEKMVNKFGEKKLVCACLIGLVLILIVSILLVYLADSLVKFGREIPWGFNVTNLENLK
jgi:hypothetical protein